MIKMSDVEYVNEEAGNEICEAIMSVVKQNCFINGKAVSQFEEAFAEYVGTKYCLGVGNGTDALEIAIAALELPKKSEVILPDNTFIATAEAVVNMGLKPIMADISNDYTIDPNSVEMLINKNTSAIIPVHLYGNLSPMDRIMQLAGKYGLAVIEDTAQSHGSVYKDKRAGSFGNIGCFSFYPSKNLGAFGDAGALVTDDEVLAKKVRLIRDHGREGKNNHVICGRNSRLDTLQAAVMLVKLKHLEKWIDKRIKAAERYNIALKDVINVKTPEKDACNRHTYHQYVIRCERRDELNNYLLNAEIECGIHYPNTVSQQGFIDDAERYKTYKSRQYVREILSLPIGAHVNTEQQNEIVSRIKEFYG